MRDEDKVSAIERDYKNAPLTERERAILDYSYKLTRSPEQMERTDVKCLREAGLGDDEILDVCQVASYYNFVNRIADGLGVELEAYRNDTKPGR